MKFLIPSLFLLLGTACNNLTIEFEDEHKPVFYVYAESGKPAYAYITESAKTEQAFFQVPDSTQLLVQMNNSLNDTDTLKHAMIDTSDRASFSGLMGLGSYRATYYKSNTALNTSENYSFSLKYNDYPKIELTAYIPESVPIDTFVITPNIAYSHGDFFMQHNLNIRFTPPEAIGHFCVNVYIDYTDTTGYNNNEGRSIRDGFCMEKVFKDDEVLKSDEYYSLNYTILSERHSGDFIPTIYLIHISDDFYNYVMQETAFIEYRENSEFFGHMPSHIPYSMVPNAYANVFAYSVTKKTGELIQLSEPTIND